jgi:hypothetical protein
MNYYGDASLKFDCVLLFKKEDDESDMIPHYVLYKLLYHVNMQARSNNFHVFSS